MKSKIVLKGCLLGFIILLVINFSCNKLDLQPLDRVTSTTFYKTSVDFDGAMFAGYSSITDLWGTSTETLNERGEFWAISLASTDDVMVNGKAGGGGDLAHARDMDNTIFRASDLAFASIYSQVYEGIARANIVIEATDNGINELTDEQKTQFVAEAKFIRAFFHFLALQMWGTPPLVLEVKKDLNNLASPNATQDALYAAILQDLQDANAGLPASWDAGNTGRATKWTAKAFEGKVNVWKKDWDAAIAAFATVKDEGPYSLFDGNAAKIDNYLDAFDFKKENGVESIFEIQYGGPFSDDNLWVFDDTHSENFKASQGTGRPWYWNASNDAGAPGGAMGWYIPTQSLVDEFEAGDPRLEATIYQAGDTYYNRGVSAVPWDAAWSSNGMMVKKYFGIRNADGGVYSPNGQAGYNNERWYRYSEMLLLYAEALIEKGGGASAEGMALVNEVRARVGLAPSTNPDHRAAVRHERRVELAFEPHRWFDITRWDIGGTVFGAAWKPTYSVFPFPQTEIDRSDGQLVQNPGY
ncbi:MAG TPA: RagB/SusD family nutrient uptake outer membrane protein [Flavitalea sp.]|nr:RagB/SusD family nutrient uptake outer membrane protein [Flavitalea sp.]